MYKLLDTIKPELESLREKGIQRGKEVGWRFDSLPFTVKLGTTTYIGAAPASGKTEIWFEFLINLSCKFEYNHIIFSPETGTAAEIYAELCYKYIGKSYVKNKGYEMTQREQIKAEYFISKHFVVIDPQDEELTIDNFFEVCDKIENDLGKKFHTTTIDPWNELTEKLIAEDLGREDKYLSRILGIVRKNAKKKNRHNCIITHVRDQAPIVKDGKTFFPMPTARDLAGGQVWFRKGFNMLMIWRPPYGLLDENGVMYEDNEVHVHVAKVKPKGTAKRGIYKLFLDLSKYQYYMLENGEKIYADRNQNLVQQKLEINEPVKADFMKIGREANENSGVVKIEKKEVVKISDGGGYDIPDGFVF